VVQNECSGKENRWKVWNQKNKRKAALELFRNKIMFTYNPNESTSENKQKETQWFQH
jgi:hypothetical protein